MFGYWRYENTQFNLLNVRRNRATFKPFKKTQQKKAKIFATFSKLWLIVKHSQKSMQS